MCLGGLCVLCIGDDVYVNGEKIDFLYCLVLDVFVSNIVLIVENFGDVLEDLLFFVMFVVLVNSGYWFFEG